MVDDGSTDACPAICDEYSKLDSCVKAIHQVNRGVSSARNVGLAIAQGRFVMFVDSDDYVLPNYAQTFVESALAHPDAGSIIGGRVLQYRKRQVRQGWVNGWEEVSLKKLKANFGDYDVRFGLGYPTGKLYKADLLKGLAFEPDVVVCEDFIFNVRYYERCNRILFIDNADYIYDKTNEHSILHSYSNKHFICRKKAYVAGKLFASGEIKFANDHFDEGFCGSGVGLVFLACSQSKPWKARKIEMAGIIDDPLFRETLKGHYSFCRLYRMLRPLCYRRCYFLIRLLTFGLGLLSKAKRVIKRVIR